MHTIAIVGAGESGVQLALELHRNGYAVTLISDRGPAEILTGNVMSSQCVFSGALAVQAPLEISSVTPVDPDSPEVQLERISLTLTGAESLGWSSPLDSPARSVDQRVKCSVWITDFVSEGGTLLIEKVTVGRLEELTRVHDLVVVSTGKGELGQIFTTDRSRSPFDKPQRALALTYVIGVEPDAEPGIRMTIKPGVGEFFTFPGITTSGLCQMMVFEGVPDGPMDCWTSVTSPAEHLQKSLEILAEHFPDEAARFTHAQLTDDGGTLRGWITPTVRHAVGTLPSGRHVFGLGDAVVLNDPLTGQGSNTATMAARYYHDAIVRQGDKPFDQQWMKRTFDEFWRGWAQWSVSWTNSMLKPLKEHQINLLRAAEQHPALAGAIASGFDDPRTLFPWWYDAAEAAEFTEQMAAEDTSAFDLRDYRSALGQFATGVTVVTTRGADGRKVGITANSFTSVSMDPPLVLWCPSSRAPSLGAFAESTHFAVNLLSSGQHVLSRQFATPSDDKFAGVLTRNGIGGIPILEGTVATFECRTVARYTSGDHEIYIGEVESYDAPGGDPLVFHGGAYHATATHPDF